MTQIRCKTLLETDLINLANLIEEGCRGEVHACHKCSGLATAMRSLVRGGSRDPIEVVYTRLCQSLIKPDKPWNPNDIPDVTEWNPHDVPDVPVEVENAVL